MLLNKHCFEDGILYLSSHFFYIYTYILCWLLHFDILDLTLCFFFFLLIQCLLKTMHYLLGHHFIFLLHLKKKLVAVCVIIILFPFGLFNSFLYGWIFLIQPLTPTIKLFVLQIVVTFFYLEYASKMKNILCFRLNKTTETNYLRIFFLFFLGCVSILFFSWLFNNPMLMSLLVLFFLDSLFSFKYQPMMFCCS